VAGTVNFLRAISNKAADGCLDTVSDVCKSLLATPSHITAFHQLELVQSMQTLKGDIRALLTAREARHTHRRGPNSGSEVKRAAEPVVLEHFAELEFLSHHGTTSQKADANALIDLLNNKQLTMEERLKARRTRNEKKNNPDDKPADGDNSDDNSGTEDNENGDGSGGSHKPHDPNKPSTDPNRPEGPDPNEDGGDSDGGDDSNGGDGDDTDGGDDNNGGDGGDTGGDSDDNNSGGNSGGSGGNDKPGGDKPPNPEEPD
jgi:hypothetical protein